MSIKPTNRADVDLARCRAVVIEALAEFTAVDILEVERNLARSELPDLYDSIVLVNVLDPIEQSLDIELPLDEALGEALRSVEALTTAILERYQQTHG